MGELILLSRVLEDRSRPVRGRAAFFVALDCPLSYLAAERVERALGEIDWVPVLTPGSDSNPFTVESERVAGAQARMALAEQQARALDLPLVEPHRYPFQARPLARAAAHAAAHGFGAKFTLAALRLAFCGGYDLSDVDVIGEAAAVAGLGVGEAVTAAGELRYDLSLEATSRGLFGRGVSAPAIRIGKHWFQGADSVTGASTFRAMGAEGGRTPVRAD